MGPDSPICAVSGDDGPAGRRVVSKLPESAAHKNGARGPHKGVVLKGLLRESRARAAGIATWQV